jgi:hypothetical protein
MAATPHTGAGCSSHRSDERRAYNAVMRKPPRLLAAAGLVVLAAAAGAVLAPGRARACGGGVVTIPGGTGAVAGAQRIFFAVHADRTDVITQIGVPATTADYGVLIPVPAQPVLDSQPVPASELDALDTATLPRIYQQSTSSTHSGIGCTCGSGGVAKNSAAGGGQVLDVSAPVNIGPVTAVVLAGDGDAVNSWLADAGFSIPADQQALVAEQAGAGRAFIALRRNDSAATGGATSVGVHFTLPAGTVPALPLRFARLGAADTIAFTIFIASDNPAAPSPPFTALTLNDLNAALLRSDGYVEAVTQAVDWAGGRAFVLEGAYGSGTLTGRVGARIEGMMADVKGVTRLTTIVPSSALTTDVTFDQSYPNEIPTVRYVDAGRLGAGGRRFADGTGLGAGTALAGAALWLRRRRSR